MKQWDFNILYCTYNNEDFNLATRVGQILGQIKFEEEYSVIRCRDPTFNIKS